MIVDDMEVNRIILENILTAFGVIVAEAKDGAEAVDIFQEESENIDLILMDIAMPNMDGYEATRKIRELDVPKARSVPIIAVTAYTYQDDIDAALESGMDFHLGKPVGPDLPAGFLRKRQHADIFKNEARNNARREINPAGRFVSYHI